MEQDLTEENLIEKVMKESNRFAIENSEVYERVSTGQDPKILAVMCSDSRTPQGMISEDGLNYVFTVKNIGNRVYDDNVGIIGDVAYPIEHLGIKLMVILGHSDCGAIKATTSDYSKESKGTVYALDQLKKSIQAKEKNDGVELTQNPDEYMNNLAILNMDYQIERLFEEYGSLIHDRKIRVMGCFFDMKIPETYIINIDGMTTSEKIPGKFPTMERYLRST